MPASHKRRVTINPRVRVVETLSLDDFSPSEIAASWYDAEEFDQITARCFKVIQKMESGKGHKYCTRGLESHSTLGSVAKKKVRYAAHLSVLEEQERQWAMNVEIDDQAISERYQQTTSSCQMWAHVVGKRDEQAIESYLYPDIDEEEDDNEEAAAPATVTACSPTVSPTSERVKQLTRRTGMQQSCARAA